MSRSQPECIAIACLLKSFYLKSIFESETHSKCEEAYQNASPCELDTVNLLHSHKRRIAKKLRFNSGVETFCTDFSAKTKQHPKRSNETILSNSPVGILLLVSSRQLPTLLTRLGITPIFKFQYHSAHYRSK